MYRNIILFFCFLFFSNITLAQNNDSLVNQAFHFGEKLEYRIYFHSAITGNVPAGKGELLVMSDESMFFGNPAYHVIAKGWTTGIFRFFAKVDDVMESYIDTQTLLPYQFERHIRENRFRLDEKVVFDQRNYKAVTPDSIISLEASVQDVLSAFYYSRILAGNRLAPGDSIPVQFFIDDSVYVSFVKCDGYDQVETEAGVFECKRLKPMVVVGEVFTEPYPATIWVTDDLNNIPIRIESGLAVGKVRVELVRCSGLRSMKGRKTKMKVNEIIDAR